MVSDGGQATAEDVTITKTTAKETGATKALPHGIINKNEQDKMLKKLLNIRIKE